MAARFVGDHNRYTLLWLVLAIEIAIGVVLGLQATSGRQAYDATRYTQEALLLASGDGSWLAVGAHNYMYPAFLTLLHGLGLWTTANPDAGRLAVGAVQVFLLYLASFILIAVLSRCLRTRFVVAGIFICGIAILPAAAWSGYWLSEALAAPILLLVIASWVATCYQVLLRPAAMSTVAAVFVLGLVSSCAWMTRPALVWIPAIVGILTCLVVMTSIMLLHARHLGVGVEPPSYRRTVALVVAFLLGAALAALPQIPFDPSIDHFFKLALADSQAQGASNIWRYSTNMSGCGPAALPFSPLSNDLRPLVGGLVPTPHSVLWTLTSIAGHLVSGWDALPGPAYTTSLSMKPWVFATLISGFVCAAPLFAVSWLVAEVKSLWVEWRRRSELVIDMRRFAFAESVTGVLVFFAVTQYALLRTSTEFRFNLMGWLSAAVCMVFLTASGWMSWRRLLAYAVVGTAISAVVLVIGQMTLDYSTYWLQCKN